MGCPPLIICPIWFNFLYHRPASQRLNMSNSTYSLHKLLLFLYSFKRRYERSYFTTAEVGYISDCYDQSYFCTVFGLKTTGSLRCVSDHKLALRSTIFSRKICKKIFSSQIDEYYFNRYTKLLLFACLFVSMG